MYPPNFNQFIKIVIILIIIPFHILNGWMCFYLLHDKLFFSLRTFINGRENKQTNKWANQRTATPATKRPRIKQNSAKNSQPVLAMALLIIRAIWIEYNLFDCVCCDCGCGRARIRRVKDFHMGIWTGWGAHGVSLEGVFSYTSWKIQNVLNESVRA